MPAENGRTTGERQTDRQTDRQTEHRKTPMPALLLTGAAAGTNIGLVASLTP